MRYASKRFNPRSHSDRLYDRDGGRFCQYRSLVELFSSLRSFDRWGRGGLWNYYLGLFFKAQDRLLGSTGINGSVWVLLGEKLIASGAFNQIVLVPAAVGGSSVAKWREGGDLYKMLKDRLQDLKANRIEVTHFLWHQGESDNPYVEPEANLTSASPSMAA